MYKFSTKQEFWKVAECWYARTIKLRELSRNDSLPLKKQYQADKLYGRMVQRMLLVNLEAIKLSTPLPPKFQSGGIFPQSIKKQWAKKLQTSAC